MPDAAGPSSSSRPSASVAAAKVAAGLALHRQGELVSAERCYLEALELDPAQTEALKLLAACSLERHELAHASEFARAALAQRPGAGELLHLLGRVQLQQGELDAAAVALSEAINANTPARIDALLDLATCHARRKAWPEALAAARSVLLEQPSQLAAHRVAGFACSALGHDAEGVAHLDQVLIADPTQASAWHASAVMLTRAGNPVAAYPRALKARELAPDNPEYAYQARVAAAAAVPDWHFNMLSDAARNAAFAAALAATIEPRHLALEIGTGSGLLALLAARGSSEREGARQVVTCEANPLLAQAAARIVAANGLADRIRVVAKPSTALVVGEDLPERADILFCEIFTVQVIAEGVLPALEDAKARLLKPGAHVIPKAATARGALVSGESLAGRVRADEVLGFDLSPLNEFSPVIQYLQPGRAFAWLSEPLDLLSFDLANATHFPPEKRLLEVTVSAPGVCQGVLQWLHLDLSAGVQFENRPAAADAGASQHWAPVFYPFPQPVTLAVGQRVTLKVSHNRSGVRVELAGLA